jgi:VIT1/CCC1 family predicted Fe2+/Mn2+ transporter
MSALYSKKSASYFRNFIFGVEDSLVSTVGLLSGVAAAAVPTKTILLTGIILVFVEAFSMGVGSLLSEYSAQEYSKESNKYSIKAAGIMFASYFAAGFIPIFPYLIFPIKIAFWASIIFSLVALFTLGLISAKITKNNLLKTGARMLIIGGVAVILGVLVGQIINIF